MMVSIRLVLVSSVGVMVKCGRVSVICWCRLCFFRVLLIFLVGLFCSEMCMWWVVR